MEDYLFVAEETSAYLLGNALTLLDPSSQEVEIKSFVDDLRRVIAYPLCQFIFRALSADFLLLNPGPGPAVF